MCDTATLNISVDKTPYVSDYDDFKDIKENLDTIEGDEFYRMELTDLRTRMDNSWYYYNGVSVFSSMAYERLANLEDDLGMMSNRINSFTYNPQTPVYNMMHSLKYIVNNSTVNVLDSSFYTPSVANDKFKAYKNNYYLPIAYLVNSETADWGTEAYMDSWKLENASDPFILQGDYFDKATGEGNPFERLGISYVTYSNCSPFSENLTASSFYYEKTTADVDGNATFYITAEKDGNIYISFNVSGSNTGNLSITTPKGTWTHSADQPCILDLGTFKQNETAQITVPFEANSGNVTMLAYTINEKTFKKGYDKLNGNQMLIEEFDDRYIKGRFTAEEDALLYTSIPFDHGWSVYIDDEKVSETDIVQLGQALLAVKVKEGNHDIEFKYSVHGAKLGLCVTLFTFFALVLYFLLRRQIKEFSAKLLPAFDKVDDSFNEDIYLPYKPEAKEPKQIVVRTAVDKSAGYVPPVKEIISPVSNETVTKEFIEPTE